MTKGISTLSWLGGQNLVIRTLFIYCGSFLRSPSSDTGYPLSIIPLLSTIDMYIPMEDFTMSLYLPRQYISKIDHMPVQQAITLNKLTLFKRLFSTFAIVDCQQKLRITSFMKVVLWSDIILGKNIQAIFFYSSVLCSLWVKQEV